MPWAKPPISRRRRRPVAVAGPDARIVRVDWRGPAIGRWSEARPGARSSQEDSGLERLVATKLGVPGQAAGLVVRRRLAAAFERQPLPRLIVVSAPPGFGKSTVLVQWLSGWPGGAGWLSLDAADNDPVVFLRGLWLAVRAATTAGSRHPARRARRPLPSQDGRGDRGDRRHAGGRPPPLRRACSMTITSSRPRRCTKP